MSTPSDYIPRYSDDAVNQRFVWLAERCALYIEAMENKHPTWDLGIDFLVMKNVAVSMMDDIWRYKIYHLRSPDKKSDSVKRSAYMTKWLTKLRPIYFNRPYRLAEFKASFDKKDGTLFINESFAVFMSLQTVASDLNIGKIALSQDFLANMYYDLHFRHVTDGFLLFSYQMIKDLAAQAKKGGALNQMVIVT